jgi:hypothetical protein
MTVGTRQGKRGGPMFAKFTDEGSRALRACGFAYYYGGNIMNRIIAGLIITLLPCAALAQKPSTAADQVPIEEYVPKVIIEGKWGTGPGEFGLGASRGLEGGDVFPDEIISDDTGNIYILDKWNNRIQKFTSTGKHLENYALDAYICPTDQDYEETRKTWNKRMDTFRKVLAGNMAWVNGHLYIKQKFMPDLRTGKYQNRILILKSGKFVETDKAERKNYRNFPRHEHVYKTGEKFRQEDGALRKFNQQGRKVFEHRLWEGHEYWGGTLAIASHIALTERGDCFYELKLSPVDNNWARIFLPDGGGMQVIKWCKK